MRDLVASGTYKSITATKGTGTDIGKIIFTFTDQDDVATVQKVECPYVTNITTSQTGTTVTLSFYLAGVTDPITMTFQAGTGDVTTDTAQTITGRKTFATTPIFQNDISVTGNAIVGTSVQTAAVFTTGDVSVGGDLSVTGQAEIGNLAIEDSSSDTVLSCDGAIKVSQSGGAASPIMDLTNAQTVTGAKTFGTNLVINKTSTPFFQAINTAIDKTADNAIGHWAIVGSDENSQNISRIVSEDNSVTERQMLIDIYDKVGTYKRFRMVTLKDGTAGYMLIPYRAYTDAGSTDAVTKGQIADIPCVHLTGNESVAGTKTFTSVINKKISVAVDSTGAPSLIAFYDINDVYMGRLWGRLDGTGLVEIYLEARNADGTTRSAKLI